MLGWGFISVLSFAVEGGGRFCAGMVVVRAFHPHPGLPPSRGKGGFWVVLGWGFISVLVFCG